jgi:hypothetical protein
MEEFIKIARGSQLILSLCVRMKMHEEESMGQRAIIFQFRPNGGQWISYRGLVATFDVTLFIFGV